MNRRAYDWFMDGVPEPHTGWTFITNHARVLATVAVLHHPAEAEAGLTVASLLGLLTQDEAHRAAPRRPAAARTPTATTPDGVTYGSIQAVSHR